MILINEIYSTLRRCNFKNYIITTMKIFILTFILVSSFCSFAHQPKTELRCKRIECKDVETPLDFDTWCNDEKESVFYIQGHEIKRNNGVVRKTQLNHKKGVFLANFYEGNEYFKVNVEQTDLTKLRKRQITNLELTLTSGVDWPDNSIRYISKYSCSIKN